MFQFVLPQILNLLITCLISVSTSLDEQHTLSICFDFQCIGLVNVCYYLPIARSFLQLLFKYYVAQIWFSSCDNLTNFTFELPIFLQFYAGQLFVLCAFLISVMSFQLCAQFIINTFINIFQFIKPESLRAAEPLGSDVRRHTNFDKN